MIGYEHMEPKEHVKFSTGHNSTHFFWNIELNVSKDLVQRAKSIDTIKVVIDRFPAYGAQGTCKIFNRP